MDYRDEQAEAEQHLVRVKPPAGTHKRRHWLTRLSISVVIILAVWFLAGQAMGLLYHGPRTLEEVANVMPGVPFFPLSTVAPQNRTTQRALAIPLWMIRAQGAKQADAALLQAPADSDFIQDWYRRVAPSEGWKKAEDNGADQGGRLLFLRRHESLQVLIGKTGDILTPVQLIYTRGMTDTQLVQLTPAPRIIAVRPSPIQPRTPPVPFYRPIPTPQPAPFAGSARQPGQSMPIVPPAPPANLPSSATVVTLTPPVVVLPDTPAPPVHPKSTHKKKPRVLHPVAHPAAPKPSAVTSPPASVPVTPAPVYNKPNEIKQRPPAPMPVQPAPTPEGQ